MNKKIFATVAILLVAVLALAGFAACDNLGIFAAYNKISEATKATQTISVKNGEMEIASANLTYDFTAKTLTGERKTPNDLSAAEMWTTETVNETLSGPATPKLSKDDVKDLTDELIHATCKVANDAVKNVFGVDATDVKGDVSLELTSNGTNLTKMVVTYTNVNDNLVTITTTFAY